MPLVTLRSVPEWAAFLAGEEISTVKSIWAEIVASVVEEKLPAITHKPVPNVHIPGIVRLIVLRGWPVSRYIWNPQDFLPFIKETIVDDAVFAELNAQLEPVLIRSIHMEAWLRDHSAVMPSTVSPALKGAQPSDQQPPKRKKRPGPRPGTASPLEAADIALFPLIREMMEQKHISASDAVFRLAEDGMVEGRGLIENRVRRVVRRYNKSLKSTAESC